MSGVWYGAASNATRQDALRTTSPRCWLQGPLSDTSATGKPQAQTTGSKARERRAGARADEVGTRGRRGSGIPRRPRPQTRRWLAAAGGWRRARGPVPPFRRGPAHRWVCPEAGARARARTWEDRKGGAAGAVAAAARIARGRSAAGAESAVCVRSRALSHGRDEHGAVAGELPVRLLAERHGGAHLRLLHHHRLQRPERPGAAARLADHAEKCRRLHWT